jgi:hypothetical protein
LTGVTEPDFDLIMDFYLLQIEELGKLNYHHHQAIPIYIMLNGSVEFEFFQPFFVLLKDKIITLLRLCVILDG